MSGFLHWSYDAQLERFNVWDDDEHVSFPKGQLFEMYDFIDSKKVIVRTSLEERVKRLESVMDGVIGQIYHGIKENPDTQNWFRLIEEYRRTGAAQRSHE
jgi:hypothetical protein